jgi:hypothetical protein
VQTEQLEADLVRVDMQKIEKATELRRRLRSRDEEEE